jgi:hypothetical protein
MIAKPTGQNSCGPACGGLGPADCNIPGMTPRRKRNVNFSDFWLFEPCQAIIAHDGRYAHLWLYGFERPSYSPSIGLLASLWLALYRAFLAQMVKSKSMFHSNTPLWTALPITPPSPGTVLRPVIFQAGPRRGAPAR